MWSELRKRRHICNSFVNWKEHLAVLHVHTCEHISRPVSSRAWLASLLCTTRWIQGWSWSKLSRRAAEGRALPSTSCTRLWCSAPDRLVPSRGLLQAFLQLLPIPAAPQGLLRQSGQWERSESLVFSRNVGHGIKYFTKSCSERRFCFGKSCILLWMYEGKLNSPRRQGSRARLYACPVTVLAVMQERARPLAYHRTCVNPWTQRVCVCLCAHVRVHLKKPCGIFWFFFFIEKMWF